MTFLSRNGCAGCGKAFPLNSEFVTIPDGETIAFDPERGRVWRLCRKCGAWNQIDGSAAGRTLPELKARFATSWPTIIGNIATTKLGLSGQLVRVDDDGDTSGLKNIVTALQVPTKPKRAKSDWLKLLGAGLAIVGLIVGGAWIKSWWPAWWPQSMPGLSYFAILLVAGAAGLFVRTVGLFRRRRFSQGLWSAGQALLCMIFAGVLAGEIDAAIVTVALVPIATLLLYVLHRPLVHFGVVTDTTNLPSGLAVKFLSGEIGEVRISWGLDPAEVYLDLPRFGKLGAVDSAELLRKCGDLNLSGESESPELDDQAHALVQHCGGLRGVLALLDDWRMENGGWVLLTGQLPGVYRRAIEWGLTQQ